MDGRAPGSDRPYDLVVVTVGLERCHDPATGWLEDAQGLRSRFAGMLELILLLDSARVAEPMADASSAIGDSPVVQGIGSTSSLGAGATGVVLERDTGVGPEDPVV
jgi:hypothetical protein